MREANPKCVQQNYLNQYSSRNSSEFRCWKSLSMFVVTLTPPKGTTWKLGTTLLNPLSWLAVRTKPSWRGNTLVTRPSSQWPRGAFSVTTRTRSLTAGLCRLRIHFFRSWTGVSTRAAIWFRSGLRGFVPFTTACRKAGPHLGRLLVAKTSHGTAGGYGLG